MQKIPRIVIGGTQSGVGKTTISVGLMAALTQSGKKIQPFKVGPDYIDPTYHSKATGRISRNLDSWFVSDDGIAEIFYRSAQNIDLAIIEGVMGLYDGFGILEDRGSTAHIAKVLKAPVVLLVNAAKMARSAAAIVKGYQELDKDVRIKGVILNNVSSERHYEMVKTAIEHYNKIPVLGYLPAKGDFVLPERHLGLIMAGENNEIEEVLAKLTRQIRETIDLDLLVSLGSEAEEFPEFNSSIFPESAAKKISLGVAHDAAFNFYYQDNLDLLESYGAELVYFSPLKDRRLPDKIDGLYIGGGYPELFADKLSSNTELLADIKKYGQAGNPIYAECGGLMYLTQAIRDFSGRTYPMVGLIPAVAVMQSKREALGYVDLEVLEDNFITLKGEKIKGHEFHWSRLENVKDDIKYLYQSNKRDKQKKEGIKLGNVLASYTHIHFASFPEMAERFVKFCYNK